MTIRIAISVLIFASQAASAQILFEGFYRIESGDQHLGYMIQRYARDAKAKTRTITTYIHTKMDGRDSYETIKSVAAEKSLKPIQTVHGGDGQGTRMQTAAHFTAGKSWLEVRTPGAKAPIEKTPLDTRFVAFPGAFLFYAADLGKLQINKNYDFNFFAERLGRPGYGQLSIQGEVKTAAGPIRQLVLDALGEPNENFISVSGDPLGSRSPASGMVVYWVKSKDQAVGTMEYPTKNFISFFGDLPEGKKNPWYKLNEFDALKTIQGFKKSYGHRKLAVKEREKITVPLPRRVN